jgi:hypothetical protein
VTEEQKIVLNRYFHEGIKAPEDVLVKAKNILQKACEAGQGKILDMKEEVFMHAVFSFHPNNDRDLKGQIRVGTCMGHHTFFIKPAEIGEEQKTCEKDAISLKKCLVGISQAYT